MMAILMGVKWWHLYSPMMSEAEHLFMCLLASVAWLWMYVPALLHSRLWLRGTLAPGRGCGRLTREPSWGTQPWGVSEDAGWPPCRASLSVVHVGNDASCLTQGGKEANKKGKGGGERSSCWSSGEWAAAPLLCLKCCEMGNPGSRGRAVCQTPSPRLRTAGARMARGASRRPGSRGPVRMQGCPCLRGYPRRGGCCWPGGGGVQMVRKENKRNQRRLGGNWETAGYSPSFCLQHCLRVCSFGEELGFHNRFASSSCLFYQVGRNGTSVGRIVDAACSQTVALRELEFPTRMILIVKTPETVWKWH